MDLNVESIKVCFVKQHTLLVFLIQVVKLIISIAKGKLSIVSVERRVESGVWGVNKLNCDGKF